MRRRKPGSWATVAVLLPSGLLIGCGGSTSSSETQDDGGFALPEASSQFDDAGSVSPSEEQDYQAFSYLANAIPVEVTVAGATGWGVIDTGDPWALLDTTTFPSTASLTNGGTVPSVEVGSVAVSSPFVIGSDEGDVQVYSAFNINANLGCTVVCGYIASLDYREVTFTLGSAATPAGLGPATTFDFSLEGGGAIDGVTAPASRIVVTVSLEGNDYSMILDTGASSVTVSDAAFSALTADGRTQISGGEAMTTSGTSTSTLTRAKTITVGGVTADGVVVAHDTSFDSNLEAISSNVGHTIDGSLGGTFLHDYYVSIDYAQTTITLAPYVDTSFILDPAEHLGITIEEVEAGVYQVASVSTTATNAGVAVGDTVTAIDGTTLSSVTPLVALTLIYGKVGASRAVTFGAATNVENMTIELPVEEELPLP